MSIYKRYSDKIKLMYFMIKDEKNNNKYMTIWEKGSLQCFYIPVILFDSVYRKDGNYFPKVFLEKFIHNFFWRSIINFGFGGFGSSS